MPSQNKEYDVKLTGREIDYIIDLIKDLPAGGDTVGAGIYDKLQAI